MLMYGVLTRKGQSPFSSKSSPSTAISTSSTATSSTTSSICSNPTSYAPAGDPKGAMLTHKNYTATVASLTRHMQLLKIGPKDVIFSYLPLAHTFEQVKQTHCGLEQTRIET